MRWTLFLLTLFSLEAQAVRLTADFSSRKDTATCDWNLGAGIVRAPQASNGTALDYGDGSDGDCVFSGNVLADEYNCRTLRISSNTRFTPNGASAAVIRVQGSVTISATLSVDGFPGNDGTTTPNLGGSGGPAGFRGGHFDSLGFPQGEPGLSNVTGAGDGGNSASANAATLSGGGGGAGGNFGDTTLASFGLDGTSTSVFQGTGGATTAAEVAADEAGFETLQIGGAGGGAGGQGEENIGIFYYGATGGGGGGALHIIAAGNIIVTGTISANGGAGGDGTDLSGAGGGGAGGSIWLQSGGHITNNGTIRALGGAGGTVTSVLAAAGGDGGDGGVGRIRLDDFDGVLSGNAPTPVAQTAASTPGVYDVGFLTGACTALTTGMDTIGKLNRFRSALATQTLNGGTLNIEVQDSDDNVTWNAAVPLSQINTLSRRYLRFDIEITPASAVSSPELDALNVDYDVLEKSSHEFKSDVSCGTIDLDGPPGPQGGLMIAGFMLVVLLGRRRSKRQA